MADSILSANDSTSTQAYDLAQQNAAEQRIKTGKHVDGSGRNTAAGATLGAGAATAAAQQTDAIDSPALPGLQSKAVVNTDAPQLPNPSGKVAESATTMRVVKGSELFASGGDGVFAALQAYSDMAQKSIKAAQTALRTQNAILLGAKQAEYDHKKDEIDGMEKSSGIKLAGAAVGFGLTLLTSGLGARSSGSGLAKTRADNAAAAERDSMPRQEPGSSPNAAANTAIKTVENTGQEARKDKDKLANQAATSNASPEQPAEKLNPNDAIAEHQKRQTDAAGQTPQTSSSPSTGPAAPAVDPAHATAASEADKKAGFSLSALGHKISGSLWTASDGGTAMARSVAMNMGSFVTPIFDVVDMTNPSGGQYQVNQAQLAQKEDQIQGQVAQMNVDSSKGALDNAKDAFKNAQQTVISNHVQMWHDVLTSIWK